MPVSPASASAEPPAADRPAADAVLVAGVNWLGDSIMSMPALQAYRQAHPQTRLVMLVKPHLAALWSLHPAIAEIWMLPEAPGGLLPLAFQAAARRFRRAFVLPHSFRSALVPFLARIPERVGLPGHCRDWMLTRVVPPPTRPDRTHQCHEYLALFGLPDIPAPAPVLTISSELRAAARERLSALRVPRVAFLPGAARGPAKRWPAEHFIALGGMLKKQTGGGIAVLGSAAESDLCAQVAAGIGSGAVSLAGQTALPELAAILSECALAVSNDSGGMHLAAAVGIPVLAIFGITDPQKTGPLGPRARVLQDSAQRSRDIPRNSDEAAASLRRITPEKALTATQALLAKNNA